MSTSPSIDNELRTRLISTLCSYQPLITRDGRDAWLLNLPSSIRDLITRRHENCRIDLAFIFDAVQSLQLKDGRWPILILIDSLRHETKDLVIGQKLTELRQKIQTCLEPPVQLDSEPEFDEIIIGEDEKIPIGFLKNGLDAAKAVARIAVRRTIGGQAFGTGWLIAPGLLITNHHVIEARRPSEGDITSQDFEQQARTAILWLGYDYPDTYTEYPCIALVRASKTLDYAILRVAEKSVDGIALCSWGILKIVKEQSHLVRGTRLNVIQHPGGRVKEIALRSNFYIGSISENSRLHYLSDTEGGSSGSPVLDDNWQVVGLHHAWDYYAHYYNEQPIRFKNLGLQYAAPSKFSEQAVTTVNEGVLIHSILADLDDSVTQEIKRAQGWL